MAVCLFLIVCLCEVYLTTKLRSDLGYLTREFIGVKVGGGYVIGGRYGRSGIYSGSGVLTYFGEERGHASSRGRTVI